VIEVVQMETNRIVANVRSSPKIKPAFGGGGRLDLGGDGVDGGAGATGAAGAASDSAGGSDSAAEEAGDADDSESGSAPSGEAGSGLIDTRNVGADPSKIDTPVTSSGNSSLWIGEDGLGEKPGGDE